MARNENMIAALRRERAVYVGRGDDERVRQVDEQLTHYGYVATQDAVSSAGEEPEGRTAVRGKQTANATPKAGEAASRAGESDKPATGGAKKSR